MTKHSARSSRSRAYEGWLWCNGSICFDFGSAFQFSKLQSIQVHDMSLRKTYLDSNRLQLASYSLLPKPLACPGDDSSSGLRPAGLHGRELFQRSYSAKPSLGNSATLGRLIYIIVPLYSNQSSSKPWIEFLTLFLFLCGVCGGFCQRRLERGSQDPQTSEAAWCLDRKLIGVASTYTSVTQTLL